MAKKKASQPKLLSGGNPQIEKGDGDIHENEELDEKQVVAWIKQAAEMPGDPLF